MLSSYSTSSATPPAGPECPVEYLNECLLAPVPNSTTIYLVPTIYPPNYLILLRLPSGHSVVSYLSKVELMVLPPKKE